MEESKDQNGPLFSTGNLEGHKLAQELISGIIDQIAKSKRD